VFFFFFTFNFSYSFFVMFFSFLVFPSWLGKVQMEMEGEVKGKVEV
jgi:hypothetical protein